MKVKFNQWLPTVFALSLLVTGLSPLAALAEEESVRDLSPQVQEEVSEEAGPTSEESSASDLLESEPSQEDDLEEEEADQEARESSILEGEEDQAEEESLSQDLTQENSQEAQEASDHYRDLLLSLDSQNPHSLIQAFRTQPQRWQIDINEMEALSESEYSLWMRGVIRDQDQFFFMEDHPEALPYRVLVTADEESDQAVRAMTPVVEIFNQAAELLNQEPEVYLDTIIEDVYLFGQEHIADYEQVVIEHEDLDPYQEDLAETQALVTALLDTLDIWLEEEAVQDSRQEVEARFIEYAMTPETNARFQELLEEELAQSPAQARLAQLFPDHYEGLVSLDFSEGRLFVVLMSPEGQALEVVLTLSDLILVVPEESEFITMEDFNQDLGQDYPAELEALSQALGQRTVHLQDEELEAGSDDADDEE